MHNLLIHCPISMLYGFNSESVKINQHILLFVWIFYFYFRMFECQFSTQPLNRLKAVPNETKNIIKEP